MPDFTNYRPATRTNTLLGDDWCPDCDGEGRYYTSRYGGNDPDVWPCGECETCRGTCVRKIYTPSKRRFRGHVPQAEAGRLAQRLHVAAQARLTLAGKRKGNRSIVHTAWHNNMLRARELLTRARRDAELTEREAAAVADEMERAA